MSTSCLAGLFDIFMLLHIWQIVCVLVTFYRWGHFVMLIIKHLNLISAQSWTYLKQMPRFACWQLRYWRASKKTINLNIKNFANTMLLVYLDGTKCCQREEKVLTQRRVVPIQTSGHNSTIPCTFDLSATTIPCVSQKRFQVPNYVTFSRLKSCLRSSASGSLTSAAKKRNSPAPG